MVNNLRTGDKGENTAKEYLIKNGVDVLEENWRYSRSEIDLIGMKDNVCIFFEVKTRTSLGFGQPESFVSNKQIGLIADAAMVYLESQNLDVEFRFDIISIFEDIKHGVNIKWLKDAFFPDNI